MKTKKFNELSLQEQLARLDEIYEKRKADNSATKIRIRQRKARGEITTQINLVSLLNAVQSLGEMGCLKNYRTKLGTASVGPSDRELEAYHLDELGKRFTEIDAMGEDELIPSHLKQVGRRKK